VTPFGRRVRELRAAKGVSQKEMAAALEVSAAWLSALENGRRGRPTWDFIQRIIAYFNVIWDDADELLDLARISHPRIVVDTAGLAPEATEFANLVAERIALLSKDDLAELVYEVKRRSQRRRR
jgi:transcriptional regulator with XRE-family HTH domain